MVNGMITTWMVWASIIGEMEEVSKVSIKMIRRKDMESISGQMAGNTKVIG